MNTLEELVGDDDKAQDLWAAIIDGEIDGTDIDSNLLDLINDINEDSLIDFASQMSDMSKKGPVECCVRGDYLLAFPRDLLKRFSSRKHVQRTHDESIVDKINLKLKY